MGRNSFLGGWGVGWDVGNVTFLSRGQWVTYCSSSSIRRRTHLPLLAYLISISYKSPNKQEINPTVRPSS